MLIEDSSKPYKDEKSIKFIFFIMDMQIANFKHNLIGVTMEFYCKKSRIQHGNDQSSWNGLIKPMCFSTSAIAVFMHWHRK